MKPTGFHFQTITDAMKKNADESRRIAKIVQGKRHQCYRNAFRAVMDNSSEPEYANATYVEGMALLEMGFPIEHAWVEKEGEIIDPTSPEEELVYFPALRYEGHKALSVAQATIPNEKGCPDLPLFYRYGWGGCLSPEFQAARNQAHKEMAARMKRLSANPKKSRGRK